MAVYRKIEDVQRELAKHFIAAWEAVEDEHGNPANYPHVLGNERPDFTGKVIWARFSQQMVSNRNLYIGDSSDIRQRRGIIRVEIHVPQDTALKRIAELEDAVIEAYEGTPPGNIRFANPFPTREGVVNGDYQTTCTIEFRVIG